ncbi:uncharacterized protein LOC125033963 isoform X2 [Penaeus chinensis]|uniref:uncharacterized protein LOC125033963 isoform X2 n=1 Tax=Penaeus chinensis TaxID=139456 RepID=UPI001FB63E78|nr:uncharacterized protein LOC125033963 isoform X2 [Penaeus chinensis]
MIIFTPYSVDEEGDAWTCSDPGVEEVAEDLLNLGAEAGLLGGPGVLVTTAGEEGEVPRRGNVVSSVAPSSVTQPATVMTGAKDVPSSPRLRGPSLSPLQTSKLSASPSSTRPLTLSDVASTLQRQQEQEQVEALGVEGRRSQFAGLREKQASFQSELSGLSLQSKSSIDSLLESREADPVDVLLSLGFGGQAQDTVTRIPERFLRPSQVPGNNIEDFLKSEDEFSDMMESAEWMPGLDPQALRRSSVATVSPLMLRLLDTIRESRSRHHQSSVSEDTSSAGHTPAAATPPSGVSKFAAVAKSLALKNSVMQTLSSGRPNKLSVLNAENRRLLDLQGQKSPEVPRKRLIIGQSSFDLGRDGELIANEDEGMGISVDQEEDDEDEDEDEEDEGDGIGDKEEGDANSEDGRERIAEGDEQEEGSWRRHGLLQHKDSVWSMASSATSIDSSEEEIREQRHRLQLSLSRRPLQPDPATLTPTTPADSLDSPQPVFSTSGADSSDRYRKIMRRLSCNKRHSTISSSGSWEMDERIPEEDLEDDVNHEPLHDQVICEADASGSLNSCSDTRASVISGSPHQRHSSSLSPEGQGSSRVQGSSPSPPVSVSNKKRQGDSSSSQNGPDSSMPLLSFSQHSHNPALIHPVPILLQHSPGPAPLPRTSRIGEEASPCLTQRGSGGVLRRQQRVDDGYADTGGRQTLQPPNLHSQHCRHQHSSGHQGRGPGNDEDRSAPTGLLCRSGSAQSDSSGFMDGDVVEAETRTPTQQNLSSVQLSTSPQAHTGHNWWWSHESGGSLETVRHAPLSRTMALRPGHSHSHYQRTPRSHLLNHQTSLPSWLRGMHDPSLSLGGQHPSHHPGGKAQVVRHHLSPDPLLFPCKGSLGSSSNHPSCNHAPCVDTSVPQLLHHCNHSVVHPYVSHGVGNTNSAFQPPVLDGTSNPGHPQDLKCKFCYPTVISTDAYTPTIAAAGFSSCNTASLNQGHQPSSSLRSRWQKRRHSLPEPLPSGVHNSNMLCSPPPSSPLTPSVSPLPITSELPFLPQSSREVHHTVNGGCARGGKTGENDAGTQCQVHSLPSLRNISAIRAAIRAEVTHMEQLMASTQHTALSPACINNVITQMVMLLQQQSELCRDLETLTVASSCTSQEGASHSTQHLSQESSFDNLPEKPNPLCQSSNPPDLIHHDTDPSPKLGNSVHETFGNHIVHDSAAWKSSEQGQGFLNFDSNLGTANHVRNDSSCANHSIEKLVFSDHSTVKTISSKHSQEKAIISGYSEQCTNIPDQKSDSERKTDWFQEPQEVIHRSIGNVELNNNSIDSCLRLEELNPDGSADHSQLASYKSTRSPFNPWNSAQGKQQGLAKTFDRHQEEALEGGTDMATFLGSGDVSSDTSSLASQVAQLVQQQVQIQTQVLEEQLHQQTKDMADIKSMMEILINKMS